MAKKRRSRRAAPAETKVSTEPKSPAKSNTDFADEYRYVFLDLRTVLIIAVVMLVVLIVLSLLVH